MSAQAEAPMVVGICSAAKACICIRAEDKGRTIKCTGGCRRIWHLRCREDGEILWRKRKNNDLAYWACARGECKEAAARLDAEARAKADVKCCLRERCIAVTDADKHLTITCAGGCSRTYHLGCREDKGILLEKRRVSALDYWACARGSCKVEAERLRRLGEALAVDSDDDEVQVVSHVPPRPLPTQSHSGSTTTPHHTPVPKPAPSASRALSRPRTDVPLASQACPPTAGSKKRPRAEEQGTGGLSRTAALKRMRIGCDASAAGDDYSSDGELGAWARPPYHGTNSRPPSPGGAVTLQELFQGTACPS
ncbi:hypothetical protein PENSPDRAFT_691409 [Peniophora sp. CONT]|nr:hypothetical protein PENSPDRAFT_691409 [Peniophora sp. CONT]